MKNHKLFYQNRGKTDLACFSFKKDAQTQLKTHEIKHEEKDRLIRALENDHKLAKDAFEKKHRSSLEKLEQQKNELKNLQERHGGLKKDIEHYENHQNTMLERLQESNRKFIDQSKHLVESREIAIKAKEQQRTLEVKRFRQSIFHI